MEKNLNGCSVKLSGCALGIAFALTFSLAILILSTLVIALGIGAPWVHVVSSIFIGFALTPKGIAIGMGWAFLQGYIIGTLISFFYNFCIKHCSCKRCHPENEKV